MYILYILIGILAFSLVIIIHELGHFFMARLFGVKVEEFSIGIFGPILYSKQGKTVKFVIKAGLFGGYVKLYGEEGEDVEDIDGSLASKSPLQKMLIFAAGPFMNVILAICLFALVSNNIGYVTTEINEVANNTPAMTSGIKAGDKIIKLNGSKISTWDEFSIKMSQLDKPKIVEVQIERDNKIMDFKITPELSGERYIIGISPKVIKPTFFQAIKSGFNEFKTMTKQTFSFFGNIFKGKVKKDDLGGPITMVRVAAKSASLGANNLLFFLALVSTQLAIFNLLPIPALDGGWIFMLLIEAITRKKLNTETVATINYIFMILLIGLMLVVLIKDIISPIKF